MKNQQYAPYPSDLAAAVVEFRYMEKWRFSLEDIDRDFEDEARTIPIAGGLTFQILVPCNDSYHPENYRPVMHYHPVPAATYNRESWDDWILECLMKTITHEACEYARFERTVVDGSEHISRVRRPWAPTHGPGDNPYIVRHYASDQQRRTSFTGVLND